MQKTKKAVECASLSTLPQMSNTHIPVVQYDPSMMNIAAPIQYGLNLSNTQLPTQHLHVSDSSISLQYSTFESHQTTQMPFTSLMMVRPFF